ncbi:MAG TPA: HIT family protein [Jatrophihabitans sp.]|jgi:histidine triad (HIT) family protein|uniref:HIT family protein n=1 Tax=Jatrophihabitans sp. TaxID=1932789 RepID=UPI002E027ECD|nr:HIT family protein [Jatrophihabitans sp.]
MTGRDLECVFCEVVAGTRPSRVVFQDDDTVAFLDLAPANPGHTLVVPREHATDLLDASPEQATAVARTAQLVARLQRDRLGADGVTLFQANRAAGWQDVFHLHVHVVPRYDGDSLRLPWRADPADVADLDAALSELTR